MEEWGRVMPSGPIGEAWELADHERGMSVVKEGPLVGRTLRDLVINAGTALVGDGFPGGEFPLMVKLIDAALRLSVQVHPDAAQARRFGVGGHGKTECWVFLDDGGEICQGTQPGIGREEFERALAEHQVSGTLNRFSARKGDVFFLPAGTVHALGQGCFLYEVQQTSDITFRVYDWDRLGLDGKPRPLHVTESLETINFSQSGFGPYPSQEWRVLDGSGSQERELVECDHFVLREQLINGTFGQRTGNLCAVATCLSGRGVLATPAGSVDIEPLQTVLVPADAGEWCLKLAGEGVRLLVATPRFG